MANDFHEIAMIGDRDSVLLAKAAGLAVFAETDGAAATRRIHRLAKGGVKVIFITEPLFAQCGFVRRSRDICCRPMYPTSRQERF